MNKISCYSQNISHQFQELIKREPFCQIEQASIMIETQDIHIYKKDQLRLLFMRIIYRDFGKIFPIYQSKIIESETRPPFESTSRQMKTQIQLKQPNFYQDQNIYSLQKQTSDLQLHNMLPLIYVEKKGDYVLQFIFKNILIDQLLLNSYPLVGLSSLEQYNSINSITLFGLISNLH
ncbi:hypothetical protein pb186bvf_000852 [Paramecium bursaria]